MGYILEDKMPDNIRPNGWYAGQNKKYSDMFNLTTEKKFAKVFDNEEEAQNKANSLNNYGWNFVVLSINDTMKI